MAEQPNLPFREVLIPVRAIYGRFWRESRWMMVGIALVVVASSAAGVLGPYVFSRLLDQLSTNSVAQLLGAFVAYAALLGVGTTLAQGVQYLSYLNAQNLNFIASTSFFERMLKKTVVFFINHNPAEIRTAQGLGENALLTLVQLGLIVLIPGVLQISFAIAVLGATINAEVMAIVVIYGAAFIAFTYFANRWTRPLLDKAIKASQENARFVGNTVNAMETLRYFNGDRWIAGKFTEKAREVRKSWQGWSLRRVSTGIGFGLGIAMQFAITFTVLLPRYQTGELSIGDIVLFNTLLLTLNQPFEMIGFAIDDLMRAWSNFMPFARMWNAPDEPDADVDSRFRLAEGRLEFYNVGYAYGPGVKAVEDVSFVAERGRTTFLTGETGSGKSTLFKLALKSIEPTEGRITVDGTELKDIRRADWYSVIGVVPQEVMLLNDSLGTNIVLGRPYDTERLRLAAERASILKFIESLENGFETTVGERGLKLSGGERQRVAIARALYADPEVLFLDEASSALDEATEAEIMTELHALADQTTIIAITHRRSVIGERDQVVALPPRPPGMRLEGDPANRYENVDRAEMDDVE